MLVLVLGNLNAAGVPRSNMLLAIADDWWVKTSASMKNICGGEAKSSWVNLTDFEFQPVNP